MLTVHAAWRDRMTGGGLIDVRGRRAAPGARHHRATARQQRRHDRAVGTLLEWRGLAGRRPHPANRRKKLIHLTGGAQDIADQMPPRSTP